MVELPKSEAELQALLDAREQEVTEKMKSKHDGEMASMRKKYDDDIKKAKEQANMSAEQLAEQKYKEQQEKDANELAELRAYKKQNVIGEKLAKENLPSYFKNDARLLNAEEGDYDKVIKDIKKDYEANLPKGATHSTVVPTQSQRVTQQGGDAKGEAYEKMGSALQELIK